jgi:hypothetical protein
MQTWSDDLATKTLKLLSKDEVKFVGTPPIFTCPKCGLTSPDQTIVRLPNGSMLAAAYGYAADSPSFCKTTWTVGCYTIAVYASHDDGLTWHYTARIDQTAAMPVLEGPCEPGMVVIEDGRVLMLFRMGAGHGLWATYSVDGTRWSNAGPIAPFAVWPQPLRLANGALVLASGRPGIGFWVATDANGSAWDHYDVIAEHNKGAVLAPYKYNISLPEITTSYTGIAELEDGKVLLTYDKVGTHRTGPISQVFNMQISIQPPS